MACAWAVVLGCMSMRQLSMWRTDSVMLEASLNIDGGDWRMLDLYAEYLLKKGNRAAARPVLERTLAQDPAYANPAKLALSRGKNLVLLGGYREEPLCARLFQWLRLRLLSYGRGLACHVCVCGVARPQRGGL